jgi:hypothetical protein
MASADWSLLAAAPSKPKRGLVPENAIPTAMPRPLRGREIPVAMPKSLQESACMMLAEPVQADKCINRSQVPFVRLPVGGDP